MANLFEELKTTLAGTNLTIVFPEGEDSRILEAAKILQKEGIIHPILIGKNLPEDLHSLHLKTSRKWTN